MSVAMKYFHSTARLLIVSACAFVSVAPRAARADNHPMSFRRMPEHRASRHVVRGEIARRLVHGFAREARREGSPENGARTARTLERAATAASSTGPWRRVHAFRVLARRLARNGQSAGGTEAANQAAEEIREIATTRPAHERARLYVRAAEETLSFEIFPGSVDSPESFRQAAMYYAMAYEAASRANQDTAPILNALMALPAAARTRLLGSMFERAGRGAESRGDYASAADNFLAAARAVRADEPTAHSVQTFMTQAYAAARTARDFVRLAQIIRTGGEMGVVIPLPRP